MQVLSFTSTTPSRVWKVAPTGQTWTQGGRSHWLHNFGTKKERRIPFVEGASSSGVSPMWMFVTIASPSFGIMYRSTQVR